MTFSTQIMSLWMIGCIVPILANAQNEAFIKIDSKLGKVIHHSVHDNQSLYSIARSYGVTQRDLIRTNPNLKVDQRILPGTIVIPVDDKNIISRIPLLRRKEEFLPVYYKVKKRENLFRISRQYFDIPTNLLATRNDLDDQELSEGQVLHIGWLKKSFGPLKILAGKRYEDIPEEPESLASRSFRLKFEADYQGVDLKIMNEVAQWKESEQEGKGLFVLHRTAQKNRIIEINNPMSDQTVYAKIIGNIPTHLYPPEIDLVISRDLAEALEAVDSKFFVRTRYQKSKSAVAR